VHSLIKNVKKGLAKKKNHIRFDISILEWHKNIVLENINHKHTVYIRLSIIS